MGKKSKKYQNVIDLTSSSSDSSSDSSSSSDSDGQETIIEYEKQTKKKVFVNKRVSKTVYNSKVPKPKKKKKLKME